MLLEEVVKMSKRNDMAHQALGKSALMQIIEKQRKRWTESEKMDLTKKVESSCHRFDRRGKGRLNVDDLYNVVKLQNKIDTSKDDIQEVTRDLDKDADGNVAIEDFVYMPIISESVFAAMDKNKDGFVSKGELKMAQKSLSMSELKSIIDSIDKNSDGQLTYDEVKAIAKKVYDSNRSSDRSRDKESRRSKKRSSRSKTKASK
eukprot:maker-scaffold373_size192110-snap-gene-0.36 protein:Tk03503 transcript:maker-scaffold373_size192110-snap-gene-0.36-mRNA-1 annotation:"PREDICTED: calmodulin-4-like"